MKYKLPQLNGLRCCTDAGLETMAIFQAGFELPGFSALALLKGQNGRTYLEEYYRSFIQIARDNDMGVVLETATWRASPDWLPVLDLDLTELKHLNREAVKLLHKVKSEGLIDPDLVVVSGSIGPRGDGYVIDKRMTVDQAREYHALQVDILAEEKVDLISALTINYVEEGIGICNAVRQHELPFVLSFTVETDGKLPDGMSVKEAVIETDRASSAYPVYYMINCAHPSHFDFILETDAEWVKRIGGIKANASEKSHAELEAATELDRGNIKNLSYQLASLEQRFPNLRVIGGCCGTDQEHIQSMCQCRSGR